ncbi:hypothetical protein [Luteimonas kalidii]|uniref:Uncharacterized protein n=1 Tax=Luteimonas kalidii TaxID=3042025 RepID=A0ABT6JYW5_9GAMM|nr:hypothetical protein [Luteimonas kalidii]MDH5835707.1 hypothetical protein [Luteimonas kalidii]
MVEGRGAYADALAQRIRAVLPDGWRGAFVVEAGCEDDDCLRWWMSSADGRQRVEQWPAIEVPVLVPEAGERHVDPRIVPTHVETMRARLFPDSKVLGSKYDRYEDRVSNEDVTLAAGYLRDGVPMRAEIHVWLHLSDPGPQAMGENMRTGILRTRVRSAPAGVFDGQRLRDDVEYAIRLEREGWDAQLDACVASARMIAHMAYVGSDEDSHAAVQACEREWEARRLVRSGTARVGGGM